MTITLPPPQTSLVAPHGGLNEPWLRQLSAAVKQVNSLTESLAELGGDGEGPVLGTAALKNIGTSGDAVPLLNTANQWSKQQWFPIQTLTDAASIAWDLETQQTAIVTLGGSRTLANATNAQPGATYQLAVIAGAHVLSFDTMYLFPANGAVPTTVGKSLFSFFCPSADELWCVGVKEFA